jgi:hypothetical protein
MRRARQRYRCLRQPSTMTDHVGPGGRRDSPRALGAPRPPPRHATPGVRPLAAGGARPAPAPIEPGHAPPGAHSHGEERLDCPHRRHGARAGPGHVPHRPPATASGTSPSPSPPCPSRPASWRWEARRSPSRRGGTASLAGPPDDPVLRPWRDSQGIHGELGVGDPLGCGRARNRRGVPSRSARPARPTSSWGRFRR